MAHTQSAPFPLEGDFFRALISIDDLDDAGRVVAALAERFRIVDDRDFFLRPQKGYRARHLQIRLEPGPGVAEVHLTVRELAEVYDVARDPATVATSADSTVVKLAIAEAERVFAGAWSSYLAKNPEPPRPPATAPAVLTEDGRRAFESELRAALAALQGADVRWVKRLEVVAGPGLVDGGLERIVGDRVIVWLEAWTPAGWEPATGFLDEVLKSPPASEAALARFGVPR